MEKGQYGQEAFREKIICCEIFRGMSGTFLGALCESEKR